MPNFLENKNFPSPKIETPPVRDLTLVITIPCHDEPQLLRTLESVEGGRWTDDGGRGVAEVIVIVNSSADAPPDVKNRNLSTFLEAKKWAAEHSRDRLRFEILHCPDLPPRHAGVGLARKIAMDEAARRLVKVGNPQGVIACLDADSQVEPNYLTAIHDFFLKNPRCPAASIHYEHPTAGDEFPVEVYAAIARYELHLRFYVHALRRAGLPTAVQTVGSSMAARAAAYLAQGGMNRRQAGEDFYFLHKFTPLGGFGEIRSTTVVPSPRVSHRVPFGTGRAVGEMLSGERFLTYSPLIFKDLEIFLSKFLQKKNVGEVQNLADVGDLPSSVQTFLEKENFSEKFREIRSNTATPEAFRKRFFRWFDAFRAMKFVHHARDYFYPNVEVAAAAQVFLEENFPRKIDSADALALLEIFREMDRCGGVDGLISELKIV